MRETFKKQSGITLIVLIITIILLLIIAGVAISIAIDGNLFNRANKAVSDTNKKVAQIQSETDRLISEWDKIENGTSGETSSGGNTTGGSSSGSGNTTGDNTTGGGSSGDDNTTGGDVTAPDTTPTLTTDRTILQIGDYVNYTPDTAETAYSLGTDVSGYSGAQSIAKDTTLNWRILSINDDGTVDIVSESPTSAIVRFQGSRGYNNCVAVLNDLCNKQYSNDMLGVTARSMNIEDIEKNLNSAGQTQKNNYITDTVARLSSSAGGTYIKSVNTSNNTVTWQTSYSQYPDIYQYENGSGINTTTVKTNGIGLSDSCTGDGYTNGITTNKTLGNANSSGLTVKCTYYNLEFGDAPPTSYFDDQNFYQLVFGTGTEYLLASRCVSCISSRAYFDLRYVGTSLSSAYVFDSHRCTTASGNRVRPVVHLGSNIKISTAGGTADSPRDISL